MPEIWTENNNKKAAFDWQEWQGQIQAPENINSAASDGTNILTNHSLIADYRFAPNQPQTLWNISISHGHITTKMSPLTLQQQSFRLAT